MNSVKPIYFAEARSDFLKGLRQIAPYKSRFELFHDFCFFMAASMRNSVGHRFPEYFSQTIEDEYLRRINQYEPNDIKLIPDLFAKFVHLSELAGEPRDLLGEIYMELDFGEAMRGQFFTPSEVSLLMAKMMVTDLKAKLETQAFVSVSDPACGAGSTLLAVVQLFREQSINPHHKLFIQGVDIDRTVALMCYVQLSLWHVPAEIIVGNSLTLEYRETWHTPAYTLGGWQLRTSKIIYQKPKPDPQPMQQVSETIQVQGKEALASSNRKQVYQKPIPQQLDFMLVGEPY